MNHLKFEAPFFVTRVHDGAVHADFASTLGTSTSEKFRKEYLKGKYELPYSRHSLLARLDFNSLDHLFEQSSRYECIMTSIIPQLATTFRIEDWSGTDLQRFTIFMDIPPALCLIPFVNLLFLPLEKAADKKFEFGYHLERDGSMTSWFASSMIKDFEVALEVEA